jgi:hypothetical protein
MKIHGHLIEGRRNTGQPREQVLLSSLYKRDDDRIIWTVKEAEPFVLYLAAMGCKHLFLRLFTPPII